MRLFHHSSTISVSAGTEKKACDNESYKKDTTEVVSRYEAPIPIGTRGKRKKLNIFMLQLPIYYILE